MDDLLFSLNLLQLLVALITVNTVCCVVAVVTRRPALAVMGSSILVATITGAAITLVLPGSAGNLIAMVIGCGMGIGVYAMTLFSIKRGTQLNE